MPRPKPWLKMWTSWLDEPKFLRLTLAEQSTYWRVYALAHRCNEAGHLITDSGSPLTVEDIANTLHLTSTADMEALQSMFLKMKEEREIIKKNGAFFVTRYAEDQSKAASETPEAIKERVKRYRDRKHVTEIPLQETPPPRTSSKETEHIQRQRQSVTAENSLQKRGFPSLSNEKTVTVVGQSGPSFDQILAKISQLFEENCGPLTAHLAERMKEFVARYHGPAKWIDQAFAEAVKNKARRWPYIETILERWQEEGGPGGKRTERAEQQGERHGESGGDIIESWRKGGWEVVGDEPPAAAGKQN